MYKNIVDILNMLVLHKLEGQEGHMVPVYKHLLQLTSLCCLIFSFKFKLHLFDKIAWVRPLSAGLACEIVLMDKVW